MTLELKELCEKTLNIFEVESVDDLGKSLMRACKDNDMCAGSGALTIQKWRRNHELKFRLYEFDKNVIPYLLFNMILRNIESTVCQTDVLQNEVYHEYRVKKGDKYGKLEVIK